MNIFKYQLKYKTWIIALATVCAVTITGIINLFINNSALAKEAEASGLSAVLAYAVVPFLALFLEVFYTFLYALAAYFAAAAVGQGFRLKIFMDLGFRVMSAVLFLELSDTAGLLICSEKFSEMGLIVILSYIPFYALVFLNTYFLLPEYIEVKKKPLAVISAILTVFMGVVSYPYTA